jgi:membrane-associated phospholipid phosphatase
MPIQVRLLSVFGELWSVLNGWDRWLFLKINNAWTNPLFDSVFPWWREANTWLPLYLFIIIFGLLNFRSKVLFWILFIVITLVITDQVSSHLIKIWVARPRPCRDETLASQVRLLLTNCSGTFSFTSSHAANHFGFAVFLVMTLEDVFGKWRYIFLWWAASVCYAQVYVGIHYPLDVIAGGLFGGSVGYLMARFFHKKTGYIVV